MCLQALSYSQGSKTRYLVRLQLHEPASASLPALLQLKEGKTATAAAAAAQQTSSNGSGNEQVASAMSEAESPHDAGDEHHAEAAHRRSSE
jgi:hypothetical protein